MLSSWTKIWIGSLYGYLKRSSYPVVAHILLSLAIAAGTVHAEISVPKQSDWLDRGIVLQSGPPGSWDARLGGMISPCTVVKKDGTYFLYYIGADGNRSTDGGPRHRALGVATSTDGINFTKYSGNPILTHLPHNNEEEGIFSAGATLDDNGDIVLYYSALDAGSATSESVDSDIRLAVSSDGFNFTEIGDVVSHSDSSVWGYGDELFPVGTFYSDGTWYVYYIAKGSAAYWDLGLAWGSAPDNLSNTQAVITSGSYVIGGCDVVRLSSETIGLFVLRDFNTWIIEVRSASIISPDQLSEPLETYDVDTIGHNTVLLDRELNTWFMYGENAPDRTEISVRTAPVSGGDTTAPTVPSGLNPISISDTRIDATWNAASDPESGIASYNIYRDGVKVGTATETNYGDTELTEDTSYTYEVSAVNGAGIESEKSAAVATTTLADTTAPSIISGTTSGEPNKVTVVFSEPVEEASSEDISNYGIDNDVTISGASLASDLKTVVLTTSPHTDGVTCTLTVNNIKDRASTPNVIAANTQVTYTFAGELVISNLTVDSGKAYEVVENGLQSGSLAYIDRSYTFKDVPASLLGATYIKTANDDKGLTGSSFITFEVNQDVTVYVAHDNRIATKPSWMASFTDTGEDLVTTDTTLSIFAKDFSAGTVTLGGNEGGGNSMYSVIIVAQDTPQLAAPTGLRKE